MIIILYLSAIVLANLSVAQFGPSVTVINAFVFIGLDLTTRDLLHEQWCGNHLVRNMAILIAAGSTLSYILNHNAGRIALASLVAFALDAIADTVIYTLLHDRARWQRINGSNVVSAAVDSVTFPAIAFGPPWMFGVMIRQFAAKVFGGFIWSVVINAAVSIRRNSRYAQP